MSKRKQEVSTGEAQMSFDFTFRAVDDNDVWEAVYSHGLNWATRASIAGKLGRKVTPGLVARIERMVSEGKLEKSVFTMRNNAQGYQYRVSEG